MVDRKTANEADEALSAAERGSSFRRACKLCRWERKSKETVRAQSRKVFSEIIISEPSPINMIAKMYAKT